MRNPKTACSPPAGLCSWITHASLFHLGQCPQIRIVCRGRLLWCRPFAVDGKERLNSHDRNRKEKNPPGKAFKTVTKTEAYRRHFQQVSDHVCEQIRYEYEDNVQQPASFISARFHRPILGHSKPKSTLKATLVSVISSPLTESKTDIRGMHHALALSELIECSWRCSRGACKGYDKLSHRDTPPPLQKRRGATTFSVGVRLEWDAGGETILDRSRRRASNEGYPPAAISNAGAWRLCACGCPP